MESFKETQVPTAKKNLMDSEVPEEIKFSDTKAWNIHNMILWHSTDYISQWNSLGNCLDVIP